MIMCKSFVLQGQSFLYNIDVKTRESAPFLSFNHPDKILFVNNDNRTNIHYQTTIGVILLSTVSKIKFNLFHNLNEIEQYLN
jgi:hypothetical protein